MNSLKAMYGCGLNFFIKLAYNSLFLYKFALFIRPESATTTKFSKPYLLTNSFIVGSIVWPSYLLPSWMQ